MAVSCEIAYLISGFILPLWFPLKHTAAAMLERSECGLTID